MVRLRSGSKNRKVQTKIKNKKKKRNSISRGTETDFDQVDDTKADQLDDSFGIWMGGKTSTPEKKDSSPVSVWYSQRRIDSNDHSAHSIVFFEETLDSSKLGTKLDSPQQLDPNSNFCMASNENVEDDFQQSSSPKQHSCQPDTKSQVNCLKDESGKMVFEPLGEMFFCDEEEKKSSDIDGQFFRKPRDTGTAELRPHHFPEQSESTRMEGNFGYENKVICSKVDKDKQDNSTLQTSAEISQNKDNLKGNSGKTLKPAFSSVPEFVRKDGFCDQENIPETRSGKNGDELLQKERDSTIVNGNSQTENFEGWSILKSRVANEVRCGLPNTNLSDETHKEDILCTLKEGQNMDIGPSLGQIPNKSRTRRCIALQGDDVMANFDDAMNDLKDKLNTVYGSELDGPVRVNESKDRSLPVKTDPIFEYPVKRNSLTSKMTSLNYCNDGRPMALSDVTNTVNFVRARYRAPADIIREPSAVTSRTLPTQRKWADVPDKHIYSNLPSMMFPCLTNQYETDDKSGRQGESTWPDFSRRFSYDEKGNCDILGNPSPQLSDPSQSFEDQQQDQLSFSSTYYSSSEDNERGKNSPRYAVNSFSHSQTETESLNARDCAQPLPSPQSDNSDFIPNEKLYGYKPTSLPESLSSPQLKSNDEERPQIQLVTTSNISTSSQRDSDSSDKNPHSSPPNCSREVHNDFPIGNLYGTQYGTDYSERKIENLNAKNRQSQFNLQVRESSVNLAFKRTPWQGFHVNHAGQTDNCLTNDKKSEREKKNMISDIPKLLEFYENQGTKRHTHEPKSRRSCMPVISTMSVSSRVNMFEKNTELYSSSDESITVEREISRHTCRSNNLKTKSSQLKHRRSLPDFPSRDTFNDDDESYEANRIGSHFEKMSQIKKETQTVSKQSVHRRHSEKPTLKREAIVLFEFPYHVTRKKDAVIFQRGEVVQVLGNWIDGQVRVRKCSDNGTEAILPKTCLFFISGEAFLTKQAGYFLYGSNYSNKTSSDSQLRGETDIKARHVNESHLLEPFLVVRPHIAESAKEVTVLRGEVIIVNSKLEQEDDLTDWSWVYVPRTQSFGFVPSSVARPLTFEPFSGCTTSKK